MKNRIARQVLMICMVSALSVSMPMTSFAASEKKETSQEEKILEVTSKNNKPVIYDKDGVKITVQNTIYDANSGNGFYQIEFMVENNSNKKVLLSMKDSSVDDFSVSTYTGRSSVEANKRGIIDSSIWEKDYKSYDVEDFQNWNSKVIIMLDDEEVLNEDIKISKEVFKSKDDADSEKKTTDTNSSEADSETTDNTSDIEARLSALEDNAKELEEKNEKLENEKKELEEKVKKLEEEKNKQEKEEKKKEKKSKETPAPEPTEAPAKETPAPEAATPEPTAETEVPASSATSIKAADNQDTSTIASDEETTYQEALNYAKEKFNYSKASELLKTIKDYKDSNERADLYDKMGDTRFINGHFYWYRDEYIELLKSNLPAMNDTFTDIQLTSSYSEPRNRITYCTDNITISYDAGDVTVTLCNGPFDEGYYDKIEINGAKKTLVNPAILTIGLARCDNDLGEATSIFKKVISEKNENGKYEYIEDGIKYSFEQNDSLMKFTLEQATTSETTIEAEDSNSNTTYNKVLRGYEAIKNNLENPDSMKVLGVKEHDSDYVFKYTTTNMYGGTVTEYSMYSHGEIADGEEIQWIAKSYYNSEKSNEINWDEVVKYSQSSAYSGNSIEN